ncbi:MULTISPECIES: cyclic lactone autoinducer peptide [Listeria]|uniref:cyclic lactone autoinducer peptide n=1 Tax=Listeria TaxID=1637 RepID=UPI000B592DEA|nr:MULTISPECIES: cyclic lactone autoinducer peptide [Listeria]
MKAMSKKMGNFIGRKLEDQGLKIANTSMRKSCFGVTYEPKNPMLKTLEKK